MDMWNTPMVQSTAIDLQVDGKRGPGKSKMIWKQLTERDCREWKLSAIDPNDRHNRSAIRAASQLPGRGPTDVDVALYLHVNQKSVDDDDDDSLLFILSVCPKTSISNGIEYLQIRCISVYI